MTDKESALCSIDENSATLKTKLIQ